MARLDSRMTSVVLLTLVILAALPSASRADFVFGEVTNLGSPVNSSSGEGSPSISSDGLSLFYGSLRSGGADIWVTTRATTDDDWTAPQRLGAAVNSSAWDSELCISGDALTLIFTSTRSGGYGGADLWMTTRATIADPWQEAVNLGPAINTWADDLDVSISADGLSLYLESYRVGGSGGSDMWLATRASTLDPWQEPVNLGPLVNSAANDGAPDITADGRVLFFSDFGNPRPGGYGGSDIWMTRRATISDPWGEPVNLGPAVNGSANDQGPSISADGSMLYFFSTRPGGFGDFDLWQAPIEPVVDFNGDGVVNAEDMAVMLHYWGQSEPLCDIGPTPLGDGVIDVHDLIVLAKHLAPGLEAVARWKLDESSGAIAHDSIGGSDATVVGGATWRPEDGADDGALELDGVDDHVATDLVADPKAGPVRVVCWVKTDVAGGVIVSQKPGAAFGASWLATDPADGTLLSGMMFPLPALHSRLVVADGQWHEVTAEWDGTYRRLWADKQEVARDTQPMALPPFSWNGTLTIGAGANLEPGSLFAGLIDDVRVYKGAMGP